MADRDPITLLRGLPEPQPGGESEYALVHEHACAVLRSCEAGPDDAADVLAASLDQVVAAARAVAAHVATAVGRVPEGGLEDPLVPGFCDGTTLAELRQRLSAARMIGEDGRSEQLLLDEIARREAAGDGELDLRRRPRRL